MQNSNLHQIVDEIVKILSEVDTKKGSEKRKLLNNLKAYTKAFLKALPEGNGKNLFVYYLFCFNHNQFEKFHKYFESLYLSKDYKFFKNLRPIDAARYARFYLGRKGTKIDLRFLPALIKHARKVKKNIIDRIRYQIKLNPLLSNEEAFEIVKKNYKEKQKLPKKRKSKKVK